MKPFTQPSAAKFHSPVGSIQLAKTLSHFEPQTKLLMEKLDKLSKATQLSKHCIHHFSLNLTCPFYTDISTYPSKNTG